MNTLMTFALMFGIGFLIWKAWIWVGWEIEKRIFVRGIRFFREKSKEKKPSS